MSRIPLTGLPTAGALLAAASGGILGSLARYGLTDQIPVGTGFPWTVFAINVLGSALLAGLPALDPVRRTPWLGVFLGTGVLGGFTTMSTASAETVSLLESDQTLTAVTYLVGTLLAAVLAVRAVGTLTTSAERIAAEAAGADA